ncbi:MAG: DUF447 family protein [Thermoprotei archaeon]
MTEVSAVLFPENIVCEVLAASDGASGRVVSPLGVIRRGADLMSKVFWSTFTYANVLNSRKVTFNVTSDALVFFDCLFERSEQTARLKPLDGFLFLPGSEAWVGAVLESEIPDSLLPRSELVFKPVAGAVGERTPRCYTRANAALIEMLVHYTRIEPYLKEGRAAEARRLYELMVHYSELIGRVAQDSAYSGRAKELMEKARSLLEVGKP